MTKKDLQKKEIPGLMASEGSTVIDRKHGSESRELMACISSIFCSVFRGRVSLCNSPGCPGTCFVAQAGLELTVILLPQPLSAGIKNMCHYQPTGGIVYSSQK